MKTTEVLRASLNSPERFFAVLATIFGLLFLVITPPYQTPDEPVHFFRAYQISEFNLVVDNVNGVTGGVLPVALQESITATTTNPSITFQPHAKYDISKTLDQLDEKLEGPSMVYDFSNTAAYGPVAYLPQAIGIAVGKTLGASPLALMYMGRFFNLMAWVIVVGIAIRLMPIKKWALVFIGLLPMALFQAASLSSDTLTLALTALYVSVVLRLLHANKRLRGKDIGVLLAVAAGLVLTKQLVFLVIPLVLMLPKRLFSSAISSVLLKFALVALPAVLAALWLALSSGASIVASPVEGQDSTEQLRFVISNPHSYINVIWNTYFYTWGDGVTRSIIGTFGWADTPLSELLVVFGYLSLAALLLLRTDAKKELTTKNQKLFVALLIGVYALAISTALYLFYSPVGFKIVYGLQGRYFIPLLILLIPLLDQKTFRTNPKAYHKIAIIAPVVLLLSSTLTIYARYFINNV